MDPQALRARERLAALGARPGRSRSSTDRRGRRFLLVAGLDPVEVASQPLPAGEGLAALEARLGLDFALPRRGQSDGLSLVARIHVGQVRPQARGRHEGLATLETEQRAGRLPPGSVGGLLAGLVLVGRRGLGHDLLAGGGGVGIQILLVLLGRPGRRDGRRRRLVAQALVALQHAQHLAYSATCDADDVWVGEESNVPMTERPTYQTPQRILRRDGERSASPEEECPDALPVIAAIVTTQSEATENRPKIEKRVEAAQGTHVSDFEMEVQVEAEGDAVLIHEGSDLFAEDLEAKMAVLLDLSLNAELKIEDLKGNALPPVAVGVVCDIDVGDAKPVAQRVRKIPPQFKEKVADLIKGLLSAGMIQPSTSPWASPIVVIVKKNGVDIRLCIDYRLVNGLTQLMVYPMPLVNDLLEDLDKHMGYCSLDMASGFWVVPMTDRGKTWDDLCEKVERLLDVCEQWHLSISVEKSEWGMSQVDYLGH
ncbi:hypothetical protein ON010_g13129 [Phytophthora cinnamomi]|nr:hypothetical protein ON010_g13129 [Phytophthora cinnamomi]